MIKIHGDHTRQTDTPPLCHSCMRALVVHGTRFGDDFIHCAAVEPGILIRFRVTGCSAYKDSHATDVSEYHETGWSYLPDVQRFISPNERWRQHAISAADPPAARGFLRRVWRKIIAWSHA